MLNDSLVVRFVCFFGFFNTYVAVIQVEMLL